MYGVTIQKCVFAGCMLGLLCSPALVSAEDTDSTYITFEVPGSTYTSPVAINNSLTVLGVYADANNNYHGFLRNVWGKITSFDPPRSLHTMPTGLSETGAVTGYYTDSAGTHGFLRSPEGEFTEFNAPDTTTTLPVGINAAGTIAGYYEDAKNVAHGFVRSRSGTIASFDAGTEGNGIASSSTIPAAINGAGIITGRVQTTSIFGGGIGESGFERSAKGVITGIGIQQPTGINGEGAIVGISGGTPSFFGVVISPEGVITTFEVQGAANTIATAINGEGAIVGQYFTELGNNDTHGFVRSPEGTITTFDPPGSTRTNAEGINDLGVTVGETLHANNLVYGFLRIPRHCFFADNGGR
jgi:hypothetical protein